MVDVSLQVEEGDTDSISVDVSCEKKLMSKALQPPPKILDHVRLVMKMHFCLTHVLICRSIVLTKILDSS